VTDESALTEFVAKHAKPYDPTTDSYDRPPFASDIKEGKNDPIYNAHSYHTKVPPRGIIPYILHYTEPGDLILDPFCGSGMTGVAAQMCATPPADILEQFPESKERVGPRACILNDLSPAACHIAYNYNTPVDVEALKREFERIKAAVKEEFDWLYGTEHYEPAVGLYDPSMPEVASRLKNPPSGTSPRTLLGDAERAWELLTKAEVEMRLGYSVTQLPRDEDWRDLDVSKVERWLCIPATIQYTIWSSVFRCEGFVTIEETVGKFSRRGKNFGKPIVRRHKAQRGCGLEFRLWDVGVDKHSNEVLDIFSCPHCGQDWTTENATYLRAEPNSIIYGFTGLKLKSQVKPSTIRRQRKLGRWDQERLAEIEPSKCDHWYPTTKLVAGEQGNPFLGRGIATVDRFWTPRNLTALARLWGEFNLVLSPRVRSALKFLFTSVSVGICSRMTRFNFGKRGNGAMPLRLFFPHFQAEANVLRVLEGKLDDVAKYYSANRLLSDSIEVMISPAQQLTALPDESVDFIFADPPFGRNIAYSELNILWEGWLGDTTDVSKEAITSNGRKWGVESYAGKMRGAFQEMFRILKPHRYALVEFNNSDPELQLFEQIKQAVLSAGFAISNMAILDKKHKSYNQVVGSIRGEETVDKDVIFNLLKPAAVRHAERVEVDDLEQQVADTVRQHLQTLPERIKDDPAKYSEEHRTTATINSMLMNTLIPRGVSVERLNLPFIERVCARYFRKIGQRWYLRGEAVGGNGDQGLFEGEVSIVDEVSAIVWLRQKLRVRAMLIGELKPLWMRATGLLPTEVSQNLILENLLAENFWRDPDTNRWREPTDEERERMNDDRSLRVLHDAERFIGGSLRRGTTDSERCEWIDVLFKACKAVEEKEPGALPLLRGFDEQKGYVLISRLFQSVLKENVEPRVFQNAEKQARVASQRLNKAPERKQEKVETSEGKDRGPMLFDGIKNE